MHFVNGQRGMEDIARLSGLPTEELTSVMEQAAQLADRARQRAQPITPAQLAVLRQCLLAVVGPIGLVILEDALEDLGEVVALGTVMSHVAQDIPQKQMQAFVHQLRQNGLA